jgi:hypothetical protein
VTGFAAGDLCSVADGEMYRIVKVLRVDPNAVHVRLYAPRYHDRPVAAAQDHLTLGTVHDGEFGIGHLPLDPAEFERWRPEVIANEPVDAEELEGYALWAEAAAEGGAGVWGAPERRLRDRLRALFRR